MQYNSTSRRYAIGRVPQPDYVTASAAAFVGGQPKNFVEQVVTDEPFSKLEPKTETNKGHSTGNRFPTEQWINEWDNTFGYSFQASSQNLGRYLLAAFGSVTTTQLVAGVNQHLFKPLDFNGTQQLPVYSILEQLAPNSNGINNLLPSMCCESLDLTGEGKGRITGQVAWRGSGEIVKPSGVTWATQVELTQGTQNFFRKAESSILIGEHPNNANVESLGCKIESWKFGVKNSLMADEGYRDGCPRWKDANDHEKGVYRSELLMQDQSFETSYVLRLRQNSPEHAALEAQTPLEVQIVLAGKTISGIYYHKLTLTHYLVKYKAVEVGSANGMVTVSVTPEILYSVGDNNILTAELINNVASYLV